MIDKEKRDWMKSVGIIEFPAPVSYMYQFKGHDATWLMTKKDIAEKSLEELQEMYEKDKEEAMRSAERWPGQKMRRVIYDLSGADVAETEKMVSNESAEIPENTFATYFDDKEKTLSVNAHKLKRGTAQLLVGIIIDHVQEL